MKKLLSALFLVALCSSLAMANVPDAQYCSVGPLLGTAPNQVAFIAPGTLAGTIITISVRNGSNNPIPAATVVVSFATGIRTCVTAVHTVTTDALGICTVALRGGGCLSNVYGGCIIVANGIEIKNLKYVRSPDNNAHTTPLPDGFVSVGDLTYFGDEYKGLVAAGCHDYDVSGTVTVGDLTMFGDAYKSQLNCVLNP